MTEAPASTDACSATPELTALSAPRASGEACRSFAPVRACCGVHLTSRELAAPLPPSPAAPQSPASQPLAPPTPPPREFAPVRAWCGEHLACAGEAEAAAADEAPVRAGAGL